MTNLKIEKDIIIKRLDGIESELIELKKISQETLDDFGSGNGWKLAQFHLHRALEGVFNISTHILSRIPGATATQYKEIAIKLGENKIIDNDFAINKMTKMAKYRNRLVHFYSEVTAVELYKIINEDLNDFEFFLNAIKDLLQNPHKFNLEIE
ncbi:MAG: DUF86 domain-containing protein [Patescibacteria group bacterium]